MTAHNHAKKYMPKKLRPLYGVAYQDRASEYRSEAFMKWAAEIDWEQFPGNVTYLMCIDAFNAGRDATLALLGEPTTTDQPQGNEV